jgi:predicted nucleic acid-binding protein
VGLKDQLAGQIVGLDTAPLLYFVGEVQPYLPLLEPFFEAVDEGSVGVVTSTLTITEVLVYPFRTGDSRLLTEYKDILLHSPHIRTLDITPDIAEKAAELRAKHKLKTPDAIQIATSISAGATTFLTNDLRLRSVTGISILVLDTLLPKTPLP